MLPYRQKKVGIIITGSEVYTGRIQDLFQPVIRRKLEPFGAQVLGCTFCDDDLPMIQGAVQDYLDQGAQLIVMTGGMSVDPDDLTPTAIRAVGPRWSPWRALPAGQYADAGLPGDVALVGVPGATVKLPTTTFDVLLPQLMTDEKLTRRT